MGNKTRVNYKCPDCGDHLGWNGECLCGWKPKHVAHKTCEYRFDEGDYCQGRREVFSGSKWWCSKHYEKQTLGKGKRTPEVAEKMLAEIYKILGVNPQKNENPN